MPVRAGLGGGGDDEITENWHDDAGVGCGAIDDCANHIGGNTTSATMLRATTAMAAEAAQRKLTLTLTTPMHLQ